MLRAHHPETSKFDVSFVDYGTFGTVGLNEILRLPDLLVTDRPIFAFPVKIQNILNQENIEEVKKIIYDLDEDGVIKNYQFEFEKIFSEKNDKISTEVCEGNIFIRTTDSDQDTPPYSLLGSGICILL